MSIISIVKNQLRKTEFIVNIIKCLTLDQMALILV